MLKKHTDLIHDIEKSVDGGHTFDTIEGGCRLRRAKPLAQAGRFGNSTSWWQTKNENGCLGKLVSERTNMHAPSFLFRWVEDASCGWLVAQGVHVAEFAGWFGGGVLELDDAWSVPSNGGCGAIGVQLGN